MSASWRVRGGGGGTRGLGAMVRVSERFRRLLRERCERLIDMGFSCFPKWADSKAPAFVKGESYQRFLVEPVMSDDGFRKLVLSRFEDPRVGGIVLAGGVGGLVLVDYDPPKVSAEAKTRAFRAVQEYGGLVYFDWRADYRKRRLMGLHAILRAPVDRLQAMRVVVEHAYKAEFTVKTYGLVTVAPSVLANKETLSLYLPVSTIDIFETLYDERLDTLPRIVEALGGRLSLARIPQAPAAPQPGEEDGRPIHGLQLAIGNVWVFLREYARCTGCEGLLKLVESLERREPLPLPYFIYQDYVRDAGHPRSSWTIAENLVFRILAEAGAGDEHFQEVMEAFAESETAYMKVRGPVDHRSLRENARRARRFKEFGHDKMGACLLRVAGLCHKKCTSTPFAVLRSRTARECLVRAAEASRVA